MKNNLTTPPAGEPVQNPATIIDNLNKSIEQEYLNRFKDELSSEEYKSQILEHFTPGKLKVDVSELIRSVVDELNRYIQIAGTADLIVTLSGNGTIPGELKSVHGHMALKVKVQKITEY